MENNDKTKKAKEVRLWIVQVLTPAAIGGTILWNKCPKVRTFVKNTTSNVKEFTKKLFKRNEE